MIIQYPSARNSYSNILGPVYDYSALGSHEFEELAGDAMYIVGFVIHIECWSMFFGKKALRMNFQDDDVLTRAEKWLALAVKEEDLERLCTDVQTAKGYHEYNGAGWTCAA